MLDILVGDCRESMQSIAKESVQCCVTSPPYFGLRDYGVDGQIGSEETSEQFVEGLVAVFREVRRVLRDDGTFWLNLGDSYTRTGGTDRKVSSTGRVGNTLRTLDMLPDRRQIAPATMGSKQLLGIPWRVALALQADGWVLRQDIIWHKSNPMPESMRDRCTKAHEYIFLLTKSDRYYFDSDAIKEDAVKGAAGSKFNKGKTAGHQMGRSSEAERVEDGKRNKRSVWTVSTKPFKGAHFATYPPDLIEPCVLAGSRKGDIVFDPFGGSGTTAGVALKHGRKAIVCELNPEFAALIPERVTSIAGGVWDLI